ncbi:MAG: hypothetical protein PF484_07155 [Bacteroidales bacterium]|jgi:hypothetical protein|nr:hypothetical protein [Bacteroidales bacterium]
MKKLFYLFLIVGLAAASCNKPADLPLVQDVIFKANATSLGFKSTVDCDNPIAQYALIEIEDSEGTITEHTVEVFYLDDTMYTNTLKLSVGTHTVLSFTLKNDDGTLNDDTDDVNVFATPMKGAEFSEFVQEGLPIEFNTAAFLKNEVDIDVLCYKATDFTSFGFSWFQVDRITVREFNFFGDFCTKYYKQYEANAIYNLQNPGSGLSHDMIAIFKVEVFANGSLVATYDNEDSSLSGAPLKVQYPDYVDYVDNFDFVLSILVKDGTGFSYKEFHTWSTVDDGDLPNIGADGVLDFVLGACVPDADLVLAPYMNLPLSATLTTGGSIPGSQNTYFDVALSGIASGYDIQNGVYGVFCADLTETISLNTEYDMNVFSSLYPSSIPGAFATQVDALDNINWLGNNLYRYVGHDWKDIQNAVWMLIGQTNTGQIASPSSTANAMANDANLYGDGFLPLVGGYAAVLFIDPAADETNRVLQLLFTLVDP